MSGLENWLPIKGYEGLYEVSNKGSVRSLDRVVEQLNSFGTLSKRTYRGKVLKQKTEKNGYHSVHLSKEGKQKTKKVHRLVAEAWIPNPENKPEVNHLKTKADNGVGDIEWATSSENKIHASQTGLKVNPKGRKAHNYRGDVAVINKAGEVVDILTGYEDIANKGYTSCGVSAVLTGRQKTHRNMTFKLLEELNNG